MMRLTIVVVVVVAASLRAQADRYELGRRVHDFEVAWDEKGADPAARKRAVPLINRAVQSFFQLNLPNAGRLIDEARRALGSAEPAAPAVVWAEALQLLPESRVVDAAAPGLKVTIKPFYKVEVEAPKDAKARVRFGNGEAVETPLDSLPASVEVPTKSAPGTPSGDFTMICEILVGGKPLARRDVRVSRIENLDKRLAALRAAVQEVETPPKSIEDATLILLVKQLETLAKKGVPETDLPASRFTFGAERLAKVTEPYYVPSRPGEFWLSIPTGKTQTVVRIRIPAKLEEQKAPVPILFALHGMGGSENLFFDAYGDGIVPRMATERGWIVVAPRVEGLLGGGPAPKVPELLEALAKRYPIDPKRVYLVGHSMGAGHALQLVQQKPELYAAVAALGGGGRVAKGASLKGVRFFVGCGALDFALAGAKALHKSLEDAGVSVRYQEYADLEHLLIVREAAPDVFKFFEEK